MFKNVSRKCRQNRGFTLMEVMVVVAILAVVVLIAVPSVIKMRQNMKFAERNDYAKSIYMAAQSNLTQMRNMGELGLLENAATSAQSQTGDAAGTPPSSYFYTWKDDTTFFDLVLPANSIDSTIRDDQIIIEYNPKAGIVYSVFYYDGNDMDIVSKYKSHELTRVEEARKEMQLGYYSIGQVDALSDDALKVYQIGSTVSYKNGQEALLTLVLPTQAGAGTPEQIIPDDASHNHYMTNLEVNLIISGENGNSFNTIVKPKGVTTNCSIVASTGEGGTGANMVHITIPLDSLKTDGSFVKIANNIDTNNLNKNIVPAGDNISITAEVTFYPDADDPIVMIESATIAGINPMYHSLTPNPKFDTAPNAQNTEKPYILAVSNGRHLQNLSYLDAEFAQNIESIVFTQQAEDPVQPENGSTEGSTSESQPANGAKTSTNTGSQENNTPTDLVLNWQDTVDAYSSTLTFHPIELRDFSYVPSILGNGVKIQNLTVSSAVDGNAGLFAALKNTSVEKITLENPIVNATGATSTGALIGTAENVSISDCDVITKNTGDTIHYYISGQGDVGGLVGTATGTASTNTISNCSSVAVVRSADGSKSNVGGLVGSSDGTDYTNCGSSATVRGGAYDDTTNYSYLGGLVGLAKNANFNSASSSASVKGTNALNDSGNYISQSNYIGGLIGRAESCNFVSDISANLTDLPAYAYGAGGLAGWIIGGEINANIGVALDCESSLSEVERFGGLAVYIENVDIETTGEAPIKIDIDGALSGNMVAGALIGSTKSTVENIEVSIDGSISGKDVAGFASTANQTIDKCRVILETKDAFIYGSNSAAGFINLNEANITNSYVYAKELQDDTGISVGKVDASDNGMASGFALTNEASIKQCMANVKVTKDSLFVRTNKDTVKNCYGWLWGRSSEDAIKIGSNCSYSYFVNGNTKQLAFYEGLGSNAASVLSSNILDTDALTDSWAVTLLNNGTDEEEAVVWESGNNSYPYPRLVNLDHKGASAAPVEGQYPFGLIYEETYEGGDKGYIVTALEGDSLTTSTPPGLNNDKKIESTTFYLYHRTGSNLPGSAMTANPFNWLNVNQLYTVYKLNAGNHTVDQKTFNSFYPVDGNTYRIRTAEQFGNIDKHSGSTFRIEKSMTVEKTIDSFSGTMEDSGDITITTTKSLVKNLSGTLSGLTVTGLTEPMVGTVKSGGKIENCTLTEVNITSGENVGAFAGKLEGGTISGGSAEGSVSGSNYVGGAIGYVKSGTVSNVTVNVAVSATGDKAGMFVGYAEGGSFTDCESICNTTTLPFGHVKTREITETVTHYTTNKPEGLLYESSFDSTFTAVAAGSKPNTIVATLSGCTFTVNGSERNALDSTVYYYNITGYGFEHKQDTSYYVSRKSATPDYQDLLNLEKDSEATPIRTNFYACNTTSGKHVRLYFSYQTSDEVLAEGGTVETPAYHTFTFTDAAGASIGTQKVETAKLSETDVSLAGYKLYTVDSNLPSNNSYSGPYQIIGDNQYLTFDINGYWSPDESIPNSIWYYRDGSWANWNEKNITPTTMAATFTFNIDDGFIAPVNVTVNNEQSRGIYEFYLKNGALHRTYSDPIITAQQIYYPTT